MDIVWANASNAILKRGQFVRVALALVVFGWSVAVAHAQTVVPGCGTGGMVMPVRTSILNTRDYYPGWSLLLGDEGTATVLYTVRTDGKTEDASIMTSSGNPSLDNASLNVVHDMVFQPAMLNGSPTACRKGITLRWLLPDGAKGTAVLAELQKTGVVVQPPVEIYPQESLDGHETGVTVVTIRFVADGAIGSASVRDPSGSPRLDAAALDYARSGAIDAAALKAKTRDGKVDVGIVWAPYPVAIPPSDTTPPK